MTWSLSTKEETELNTSKYCTFACVANARDKNYQIHTNFAKQLVSERMVNVGFQYDSVDSDLLIVCDFGAAKKSYTISYIATNRIFGLAPADFQGQEIECVNERLGYWNNISVQSIVQYEQQKLEGTLSVTIIDNKNRQVIGQYQMQGLLYNGWTQEFAATMPYLFREQIAFIP
jgi:hypothetical protein